MINSFDNEAVLFISVVTIASREKGKELLYVRAAFLEHREEGYNFLKEY